MKVSCNSSIAILMATYNGERYLREQMDSLLVQTCDDWHLFVHDDGSQDDTINIVTEYKEKHPDKITILTYPSQGGACKNFLSMLERVDAPYYMFCDQDDVWLPEKTALSLQEMKVREQEQPEAGIIICTDLTVVAEDLKVVNRSMWEYLSNYPEYIRTFRDAGASAIVTGCAMLFNRKAKEACLPYSSVVMMHDCWVCLCCLSQQGRLYGIPQQTIYYRQHGDNSLGVGVGAAQIGIVYRLRHFIELFNYNAAYYRMLSALGYGSVIKYLAAKLRYRRRIKRGYY